MRDLGETDGVSQVGGCCFEVVTIGVDQG
jgi:hypothetical protein